MDLPSQQSMKSHKPPIVTYPRSLYSLLGHRQRLTEDQYVTKLAECGLVYDQSSKHSKHYKYRVIDITKYRVAKLVHGI